MFFACSGKNEPSKSELKGSLIHNIPGYIDVKAFLVEASQNFGNKVEPNIGSRFKATVVSKVDLYKKDTVEKGIIFVQLSTTNENQTSIFGQIKSNFYQGAWRHKVSIEGNPITNLGIPLNQFSGGRVIIRGSEDEKEYIAEQERKQAELRKNIANAKKILVGQWRNEDGLSTCKSDGSWNKLWDKGSEGDFLWDVKGDYIEWSWKRYKPKNGEWKSRDAKTQREQIIYINNNRYSTKDKKGNINNSRHVQ